MWTSPGADIMLDILGMSAESALLSRVARAPAYRTISLYLLSTVNGWMFSLLFGAESESVWTIAETRLAI
jgi:hypothetical protein